MKEETMALHPDRLFPVEPEARAITRRLYDGIAELPIVSPHGHTEPAWYATDAAFPDPATLFVKPDHYVTRMLYSQGVKLEALGIQRRDGGAVETDGRKIWRLFAENFFLFAGTPSRLWFEHSMESIFGITERLGPKNADTLYDRISADLATPRLRPRALYKTFNIEVIATTDAALDDLAHHDAIRASGWKGRVVPTYRPDAVIDPQAEKFAENLRRLVEVTGNPLTWDGYLDAHRARRAWFKERGATATDHGHPPRAPKT
ncbi:glucuronate isomerase [Pseudaminobacter sp. NGMCC 1.201702]|uniref:glucuronate isomerase n=1 Tax=Pseudaminobacter sp. NGMCC 1.201702 TaxID=3391825 RepID=UPI0039F0923A